MRGFMPKSTAKLMLGFAVLMALISVTPVEGAKKYPTIDVDDNEKTVEQEMRVRHSISLVPHLKFFGKGAFNAFAIRGQLSS